MLVAGRVVKVQVKAGKVNFQHKLVEKFPFCPYGKNRYLSHCSYQNLGLLLKKEDSEKHYFDLKLRSDFSSCTSCGKINASNLFSHQTVKVALSGHLTFVS